MILYTFWAAEAAGSATRGSEHTSAHPEKKKTRFLFFFFFRCRRVGLFCQLSQIITLFKLLFYWEMYAFEGLKTFLLADFRARAVIYL